MLDPGLIQDFAVGDFFRDYCMGLYSKSVNYWSIKLGFHEKAVQTSAAKNFKGGGGGGGGPPSKISGDMGGGGDLPEPKNAYENNVLPPPPKFGGMGVPPPMGGTSPPMGVPPYRGLGVMLQFSVLFFFHMPLG